MGKLNPEVLPSEPVRRLTQIFRNIGVLQTTVAELVTVKEHQRKLGETSLIG